MGPTGAGKTTLLRILSTLTTRPARLAKVAAGRALLLTPCDLARAVAPGVRVGILARGVMVLTAACGELDPRAFVETYAAAVQKPVDRSRTARYVAAG